MTRYAAITGVGSYLPERRLTNVDLESMVDTSDEWIVSRTGISERRLAGAGEATSDLAVVAARRALERAKVDPADIDLLVVGTSSPDYIFPSTAALVQDKLGLSCGAFDVMAACTSFIHALYTAASAIEAGRANRALVIGAEALTRHVDFTDRATCVLFGDGAGAVVLEAHDEPGVESMVLGTDGSGAELLKIPAGGSALPATEETCRQGLQYLRMNGNEVFKFAVRAIPSRDESRPRIERSRGRRPRVARAAPGEPAHHRHRGRASRHASGARLLERLDDRQYLGRVDTAGPGRPVY